MPWLALALLILLNQPATAATVPALVVIFPDQNDVRDPAIRRRIKAARVQAGQDTDSMPLMRLYWSLEGHRRIIEARLGLAREDLPLAGLVERDPAGWPVRLVERLPLGQAELLVDRYQTRYQEGPGLLVVARGDHPEVARELQLLLGAEPSYPVRRYDVNRSEHRDYVEGRLGVPASQLPLVAVARFRGLTPYRLVWRAGPVEAPATAARELVAALQRLTQMPAESPSDRSVGPPTLPLATDRETLLAICVRARELARQLRELEPAVEDVLRSTEAVRQELESGAAYPQPELHHLFEAGVRLAALEDRLTLPPAYRPQLESLLEKLEQLHEIALRLEQPAP